MKTSFINRILLGTTLALTGLHLSAGTFYNGTISGTLRDGETQEAIPNATVAVLRASDNAVIQTVRTAADGSFRVRKVPFGNYKLTTTVLGFRQPDPRFVVNGGKIRINMGTLNLVPMAATALKQPSQSVTQLAAVFATPTKG